MTFFHWFIGTVAALFGVSAALSFVVYISTGIDLWISRARNLRRLSWASCLVWFNVWIWRQVALIIIHW
jgi:hypothetical protein